MSKSIADKLFLMLERFYSSQSDKRGILVLPKNPHLKFFLLKTDMSSDTHPLMALIPQTLPTGFPFIGLAIVGCCLTYAHMGKEFTERIFACGFMHSDNATTTVLRVS